MIKTYKLYTGKYDQQVALALPKNVTGEYFTRGNCNKLLVKRCRYEPRKNFFSNRIVNIWNSLPDYVVMYDTINTFKNRHWKHRDFLFHYRATYTGTGDQNLCLSIRKLISVVKDVDLEAMPTSIFLDDDDDDDDDDDHFDKI